MPDNRIRTRLTDTGSKLRIKNATTQDSGMYRCVAKNPHGYSTSEKTVVHVIGGAGFYAVCHTVFHVLVTKFVTQYYISRPAWLADNVQIATSVKRGKTHVRQVMSAFPDWLKI